MRSISVPAKGSELRLPRPLHERRGSEALALLSGGPINQEIGRSLGPREIRVKLHLRSSFCKLGVRNRVEAANSAGRLKLGVAPPP